MNQKAMPKAEPSLWLYNPWLDMIVGCGAWSAPLLLLTYFAADSSTIAWSAAFYFLALFFNFPHYMATIYRAYRTSGDIQKYRVFTVHITGLVALTLLLAHFWVGALPWIFTLYLTWSPWHYGGQNYGLFMMFARRAGAAPSQVERRALYGAFIVSYLVLFLTLHTGTSNDPLFLSLGIPEKISHALTIGLGLTFVGFSVFGIRGLARQASVSRLLPALTLYSTQVLWFLVPTALAFGERLQVPPSRYSTGVMALMHSAQYLWITSYYARREARTESARRWRPWAYFGVLIAGGIALFIPGPWVASRVFHFDFTSSFLIFTALVNIHHFILDGAIWKLRDGRIAKLLLGAKGQPGTPGAAVQGSSAWGWITGNSTGARALRIGTAAALLILGSIDQARYYFALHRDSLHDLQKAAAMNGYDSSLQSRIANEELEVGDTTSALAAWQKALAANPRDRAKRDLLLKYWTQHKQFREAYQLTSQSLKYAPNDANLLVNHGILAQELGHNAEAIDSWKKALALDPGQLSAALYLASELDREQKPADAIPYYTGYLEGVAKAGVQHRPPAVDIIATILRLAQCQSQTNQPADAGRSYELARTIAAQSGEKKLESFASASGADIAASLHNTKRALELYQAALNLDRQDDDHQSAATDWYNYGMFLRSAGYPSRLVYACLVKSESLLERQSDREAQLKMIVQAREDAGKALVREKLSFSADSTAALDEALHLTAPK